MKVYVIFECIDYCEGSELIIQGVVSSAEQAEKICVQLEESVKKYNETMLCEQIGFYYDEFELDDMSKIDEHLKYHKERHSK